MKIYNSYTGTSIRQNNHKPRDGLGTGQMPWVGRVTTDSISGGGLELVLGVLSYWMNP